MLIKERSHPFSVARGNPATATCQGQTQCFFQWIILSGLYILISWTLNWRICINMKSFVQEARPRLITTCVFTSVSSQRPRYFMTHCKNSVTSFLDFPPHFISYPVKLCKVLHRVHTSNVAFVYVWSKFQLILKQFYVTFNQVNKE